MHNMVKEHPMKSRTLKQVETFNYPRWDGADHVVENEEIPEEEVEEIQLPTAADVQKIHDDAYTDGYAAGVAQGQEKGHSQGLQQGIDEGKTQGLAEGKKQGYEEGHKQGLTDSQSEIDQFKGKLSAIIAAFEHQMDVDRKSIEQGLVSMLVMVCRNILLREINQDPEVIRAVVTRAVDAMPDPSQRFTITVNPDEVEWIKELAESRGDTWKIVGSDKITTGGCTIESERSLVDYTLEHRFQQQIEAILEEAELEPELMLKEITLAANNDSDKSMEPDKPLEAEGLVTVEAANDHHQDHPEAQPLMESNQEPEASEHQTHPSATHSQS